LSKFENINQKPKIIKINNKQFRALCFRLKKKQNKNILNTINNHEKMKAKVMEQTKLCKMKNQNRKARVMGVKKNLNPNS
jgi:hypothetical protein